jgi:hypothetical protein
MMIGSVSPAVVPPRVLPPIEVRLVAYNTFEVVRHGEDDKHHEQGRHGDHKHAPGTRIVPATVVSTSTNGSIVAMPDLLEYVPGAASDQIVEGLKFFYVHSARPMIHSV